MSTRRTGQWLAIVACVVVVAALAAAIGAMNPPSVQRDIRLDERRAEHLDRLHNAAVAYFEEHRALPEDLKTLAATPGLALVTSDPVTGTPYAYTVTGARAYRLCAVFATDTATAQTRPQYVVDQWRHGRGQQCFDRSIEARSGIRQ